MNRRFFIEFWKIKYLLIIDSLKIFRKLISIKTLKSIKIDIINPEISIIIYIYVLEQLYFLWLVINNQQTLFRHDWFSIATALVT